MTTPSEDEILALAKKATPGPWDCRIAYESDGGVVDPHTYKAPGYYNNGGVYSPTADQWPVACDEYNIFEKPDDWAYIAAANPSAIIALIERHRAEIEELRAEADRWARRAGQSAAEVERLTRERDEARELAGEAKCKNCGSPIAKCQQCRREGYITCCPECDHESAESTLAAAQKRVGELEGAIDRYRYAVAWASADAWDAAIDSRRRFEWASANDCDGIDQERVAEIGKEYLQSEGRAALAGKEPDNG